MSEKKKTVGKVAKKSVPTKKDDVIFKEDTSQIKEEELKAATISVEDHQRMMKRMAELEAKLESAASDSHEIKEALPMDDFMDEAAIFFSYSSMFSVWGDKRRGKVIPTPSGAGIKFEKYYRFDTKTAGTRGTDTVSICRAVIRSKSEADWLRGHTQFGIKFFENIKSAIDQDVFLAEKMVQVNNMVSGLGDMQVIARAKSEGINISDPDIGTIRQQLVKKIATKEMNTMRKAGEAKAKALGLIENKTIGERAEIGGGADGVY